ncbi:MAG: type I-E CRISPR-associated protein Cas6/Cse3/CasE [Rhodospirillales bacterium]|nr:MAG: type I-E CRISPR-associated protein Cas6/Cse3/CasE [Rhodospirillales bacterium]
MTAYYLSRARLRRDPDVAALAPVLMPADDDARVHIGHRLVWTLFADGPDRRRDFLWREVAPGGARHGRGTFFILSERPPDDRISLFDLDPPKAFAPTLSPGDRLGFSLRANPVVTRSCDVDGRRRQRRHDVAMDLLRTLDGARAERRLEAITDAGRAWLVRQGERNGFRLPMPTAVCVDGYHRMRLPRASAGTRGRRGTAIEFSVLDFDGILEVLDPEVFLRGLYRGFGKGKAFGCGLMLIRRV